MFDTRHIIDDNGNGDSESHGDIPSDSLNNDVFIVANRVRAMVSKHNLLSDLDSPSSDGFDNSDNNTWANTNISKDINNYIYKIQLDHFSNLQIYRSSNSNNNSDVNSDISSIIDNGFLAGNKEIRTIFWRYVSFYIIYSLIIG